MKLGAFLKITLLICCLFLVASVLSPQVFAQNCTQDGQCTTGGTCVCIIGGGCHPDPARPCQVNDPTALTGQVKPPKGVLEYNAIGGGIGILRFASNIIFLLNVGAGLFAMYNFLMAGLLYITSAGSSDTHNKVKDKLTFTFVGLALVVSTFTVGGIIGLVFYGDAGFLLNPQLGSAL